MTISQELIEAMDDCAEFGALHNRDPLNDYHRRPLYAVQAEPVLPTEPFAQIEVPMDEDYTTVPLIALVAWLLFVAICAWIDSGFPIVGPL